jgi:putative ABC transport system permease protein
VNVLAAAPWTRAPLLLLRRPLVFVAIVVATAVLAVAAASGVLFQSSVGTASLQVQAKADCPELSLPGFQAAVPPARLSTDEALGRSALTSTTSDPAYSVVIGTTRIQSSPVDLYSRAGALDHVVTLTPDDGGAGAWFPDNFAAKIGAVPGQNVTTADGTSIRVAGIYRALAPDPYALSNLPRYWCTWHDLIVPKVLENPTGPWLISDPATVAAAVPRDLEVSWFADRSTSTPLSAAQDGPAEASAAAAAFARQTSARTSVPPDLANKIDTAQRVERGLSGSVVPIDLAGVVVAALLVAGAGGFWATARSREIRWLVSRGVGPAALGLKAVLETAPAALVGLAGGVGAALVLVRGIGPTSVLEPGAQWRAFGLAALAVAGALLIIAAVGALAGRERVTGGRRTWVRDVPWELALLAPGIWAAARLRSRSAVVVDHAVVSVDPLTFVFPLLAASAIVLLLARVAGRLLPRLGRAQPRRTANYLAIRRLAGSRAVVLGVLVGTALPCGLLTYASTVTHGISSDITAKARTNLGAPHVLEVRGSLTGTPRLEGNGTPVAAIDSMAALADGTAVNVLGVDPATFADFAYVSSAQRSAVAKIGYTDGAEVPAILVNAPVSADATSLSVGATQLDLAVRSRMPAFPGLRDSFEPLVVIDRAAFSLVDPAADRDNQVWTTNADYGPALRAIAADGYTVLTELSSQVLIGNTGLLPVTWIFGYLRALAVLIGVVALAGLVFGLAARSRRRVVSYVLSRQMGMSQSTHLKSLAVELLTILGAGWLIGCAVGAAADDLVYRNLDVFPELPPAPTFALPTLVLAVTAAIVVVVVVIAALGTHWASERARPAEILRLE